jgi:hypothetical protein
MYGLRVVGRLSILKVLEPIQPLLDTCWWYLDGAGIRLPPPRHIDQLSPPQDTTPTGWAKWREENREWLSAIEEQSLEYAMWMDDEAGYRVGLPGWYSRYAEFVDTDWALYFACESPSGGLPRPTLDWLDALHSEGVDWFGDANNWSLPADVVLVWRDVDNAYWDLFFGDQKYCNAIRRHLRQFANVECSPFVEHASE